MLCYFALHRFLLYFFFFNDTATTEIYTLSLHDALPISTTSRSVISRSSWNVFTKGCPIRADTFQSMARKSSPCWYSRTSANSMPWPRKTERYSPVNSVLTRVLVRSSIPLTCRSTSAVTARRRARTGGVAPLRRSFPSYVTARPRPPGSERSPDRHPCLRLPPRRSAARGVATRPRPSPSHLRERRTRGPGGTRGPGPPAPDRSTPEATPRTRSAASAPPARSCAAHG